MNAKSPARQVEAKRCARPRLGLAVAMVCALLVLAYASGFFERHVTPSASDIRRAAAAIVFTGQFERIDAGLRLLDAGLVTRVHISGLNQGAGLVAESFVRQFSARNPDIHDVAGLVACCVSWSSLPETTFQNADEARCWLDGMSIDGPVLLITSRGHLPRAYFLLSRALGGREVISYPVDDNGGSTFQARLRELGKLVGAVLVSLTPGSRSLRSVHGPFAGACPVG